MPIKTFRNMVNKITTPNDVVTVLSALYNYIGHRNIVSQSIKDLIIVKALEIGAPAKVLPLLEYN